MEQQPKPSSALPRLSKLPAPRPVSQLPRPPSPTKHAKTTSNVSPTKRMSVAIPRPASALSGIKPPEPSVAARRQPLTTMTRRPQSMAIDSSQLKKQPGTRHSSQEENELYATGSDASDVSPTASSTSSGLPTYGARRPRTSLSDRTIQSLTQVPPSPATTRRRSSFFNPQSPMTSPQHSHPPSSFRHNSVSKINYGGSIAKPPSPMKTQTPVARRSISSGVPKAGPTSGIRAPGATGMTAPKSIGRPASSLAYHGRPASGVPAPTPTKTLKKPGQLQDPIKFTKPKRPATMMGPPKGMSQDLKTAASLSRAQTPTPAEQSEQEDNSPKFANSSAALRQQIAKAKSAAKAAASATNTPRQDHLNGFAHSPPSGYDFESCDDPFGQHKPDGKESLRQKIDNARRDGKLNIAGMEFKAIPEEVLQMYDAAAMESSSVSWSETVDLIKFNAADNEIEELEDHVFPDIDKDAIANDDQTRGLQFAGIKALDLHGNRLIKLPAGLRRLERLTSLDLCRNMLDNQVFDIVKQLTTLRELNLSGNKLTGELPRTISSLNQLEVLNVSSNKLASLPGALKDLTKLRILNISQNRLMSVDMGMLAQMPLIEFYASDNALTGALFPSNVTYLDHMEVLEVANNSIATLSFASTKLLLPALKRLNVSSNRLILMPDVSTWQSMVTLLAEDNQLPDLPEGFINLRTNLKHANFERNNIRMLDEGIAKMDVLETLSLGGNPMPQRKYLSMTTENLKRDLASRYVPPAPTGSQSINDDETF